MNGNDYEIHTDYRQRQNHVVLHSGSGRNLSKSLWRCHRDRSGDDRSRKGSGMNERIKGLISQAHILAAEQHRVNCLATGKDPSMPHAGALNMTFEKFAELIIKECRPWLGDDAFEEVKNHLGVEE
jgi:hypothetical protein